jgi:ABC-type sugar transport system ATPase subunit
VIRDLREQGAAILYVSHRLDEVMALADRVTVLRDGRSVLSAAIDDTDRTGIIRAMTGRDVTEGTAGPLGDLGRRALCRLEGVAAGPLHGLSLELREGEVLGLAGLEKAGSPRSCDSSGATSASHSVRPSCWAAPCPARFPRPGSAASPWSRASGGAKG